MSGRPSTGSGGSPAARGGPHGVSRGGRRDAAERLGAPHPGLDALPADVRRRAHQAAGRCLLARAHVPGRVFRDAADAKSAQLVLPLDAGLGASRRGDLQPCHRAHRALLLLCAAAPGLHRRARDDRVSRGARPASGNLSWLNWLTVVLCLPLLDDRWWTVLHLARVAPTPSFHDAWRSSAAGGRDRASACSASVR